MWSHKRCWSLIRLVVSQDRLYCIFSLLAKNIKKNWTNLYLMLYTNLNLFLTLFLYLRVRVMVFNATFNNISVILWQSVNGGWYRNTPWKSVTFLSYVCIYLSAMCSVVDQVPTSGDGHIVFSWFTLSNITNVKSSIYRIATILEVETDIITIYNI